MTEREVLNLALEALELEDMACRYEKEPTPEHIAKAITAIKEALAQPEQELLTWAGVDFDINTNPPQRTWVGLTDEEIAEIMVQIWSNNNISVRERSHRLARAIEVKLKDKNT